MRQTAIEQRTRPARAQIGDFYRADLPMMVLELRDQHQGAITIQAGEVLEVVGPAQDERFLVVDIKGERFLIFEYDLNYRGRRVSD